MSHLVAASKGICQADPPVRSGSLRRMSTTAVAGHAVPLGRGAVTMWSTEKP
jgi:hypothetical protein